MGCVVTLTLSPYHSQIFFPVVVNKDGELDRTVEHIEAIITAEKARVHRRVAIKESNCQS